MLKMHVITTLRTGGEGPDSHNTPVTDTCNTQVNTILKMHVMTTLRTGGEGPDSHNTPDTDACNTQVNTTLKTMT